MYSIKRIAILFLTILLVRTTCFSSNTSEVIEQDSTVLITSDQLKSANLIFVEHKKLLEENRLLNLQIQNYQTKTDYLLKTDSLRTAQITNYQYLNESYATRIEDLNKAIKRKNRAVTCWKIGGITVSIGLILFLLLK